MVRPVLFALVATACGGGARHGAEPTNPAEPGCEPGRCIEDFGRVIGEHRAETRACYDKARKSQPTLAGHIIINFEVDPTGKVVDASQGMQDEQITDQDVVGCVTDVVKATQFAKSPGGKSTRAYHRFELSPR